MDKFLESQKANISSMKLTEMCETAKVYISQIKFIFSSHQRKLQFIRPLWIRHNISKVITKNTAMQLISPRFWVNFMYMYWYLIFGRRAVSCKKRGRGRHNTFIQKLSRYNCQRHTYILRSTHTAPTTIASGLSDRGLKNAWVKSESENFDKGI